jgi:hypothetical protein
MRTSLLLVPGLLIGCGDNIHPETDEQVTEAESEPEPDDPAPVLREIQGTFDVSTISCDAPIGRIEARAHYVDDGSLVPNPTCRFLLADGLVFDGCLLEHEFPSGGVHDLTLIVTDPATGATSREASVAFVYPPLVLSLEASAPECGLELSWVASTEPGAQIRVFVEPADKVVSSDPNYFLNSRFTVGVSEAGTYRVRMEAEDERTTGGICVKELSRDVAVVACHEHDPTCEH